MTKRQKNHDVIKHLKKGGRKIYLVLSHKLGVLREGAGVRSRH